MEFLAAELPFTLRGKDDTVINGVMDAVFKTKDGGVFIADYKSDNIKEEDLAEKTEFYKQQLLFYKDAAKEIKALLDDYHKYSIFCRFRKETRKKLLLIACIFFTFYAAVFYHFLHVGAYPLLCTVSAFPLLGIYLFYLWYKDTKTAKQLARLKGKK